MYVLKEITDGSPADPAYLTTLETPRYYTLKHRNDMVSRVYHSDIYSDVGVYTGDDFYSLITQHYATATLPSALKQNPEMINQAAETGRIIINRKRLPADLSADTLIRVLDDSIIVLDDYFDENGYVVAQINRLAELPEQISDFIDIGYSG